jgi:hypothetical protein
MNLNRSQLATLAAEIEQSLPAPEWDSIPELKRFRHEIVGKDGKKAKLSFDQMVVKYKELDAEIKFREKIKADLKDGLEAAMLIADCTECECEGYPVQRITKQGSRKISVERLLGAGVLADTIAQCTEIGPEVTYVQIGKPKKDQ